MDRRIFPRFEPALIDVEIEQDNTTWTGRVLDASSGGMAIAMPENVPLLDEGSEVLLTLLQPNELKNRIGNAVIKRNWVQSKLFDSGKGSAIQFLNTLNDDEIKKYNLKGNKQEIRVKSQAGLADHDITHLGEYRRDLIGCQLKLFMLTLTLGVAMATAYFGITYQNTVHQGSMEAYNLPFWRTMFAALPGLLALGCGIMFVQKSISVQRIDAYLILLKQYFMIQQYPREYKGWEIEYSKFRNVLGTHSCTNCAACGIDENGKVRKCGDMKKEDHDKKLSQKMFSNPRPDFYRIIILITFFSVLSLSLVALIMEVVAAYQNSIYVYMAISSIITLIIFSGIVAMFTFFYHLRIGRFSMINFNRCWSDLFNNCRMIS